MTKRKRRNVTYKDWITEEGLIKIEGWARDGLINEQIAEEIGIHPSTLYDWQKKYPEIAEALKKGKEVIDRKVENALLKRALGYQYEEKTYERIENTIIEPDGSITKEPGTKIKTVIKEVVPDTTAQIFWLKNRKPDVWRDRKDIDLHGNIDISERAKEIDKYLSSDKND